MDNQTESNQSTNQPQKDNKNTLIIVLVIALIVALVSILVLLFAYVFNSDGGSGPEEGEELPPPVVLPPPMVTVEATLVPPTPEPGDPVALVISPIGVNVRTGPGLEYPVIGVAPVNSQSEVVGVSQDRTWWVVNVPSSQNNQGWVADEYVEVENGDNVLVIPAPPTPTPAASPTPTATPAPEISFNANRTTINAGEKATLSWSVENIVAVYMYPVGDSFENHPVTGQGSREVQPYITTSYELLTFNRDNTTSAERIEITVVSGLTSGRWILQSYSSGSSLKTPIPGTEITARFATNGDLSGSAGCNNYSGGFMAFDQTLRMRNISSSQVFCAAPEGIMEQEGEILALMIRSSRMAINAGQLEIFDGSGKRIMVFING